MRKCLGRSLALPISPKRFVGLKSETASKDRPGDLRHLLSYGIEATSPEPMEPSARHTSRPIELEMKCTDPSHMLT